MSSAPAPPSSPTAARRAGRFFPAMPLPPHFMGCAPLDAWARLLLMPPARIGVRYWPRLLVALAVSALITALTLPERLLLAPILFFRGRASRHTLAHKHGVVVVLGYYRSGTTHLHNLLACDRGSQTPRWFEALVPHGFLLSWNFLRLFLLGFLSTKRPQDDMAFGPEWPAEDDFALNNWCVASSLAGRVALPARYEHFQRFHFLEGLTAAEMQRWRSTEWKFLAKLAFFAMGRRLLLKTPSHTARVAALVELFGRENVKFVHVSRSAADVVRSNVAMLQRMSMYNLQDPPSEAEFTRLIVDEYDRTEKKFLAEMDRMAPGALCRVRFQDVTADPIGELKRIYGELGLAWTDSFERAVERYLDSVREYRPASQKREAKEDGASAAARGRLAWMHEVFGHGAPGRAKVESPRVGFSPEALRARARRAWAVLPLIAVVVAGVWLGAAMLLGNRSDWMVWLAGVTLGVAAQRIARVGTVGLGIWAGVLTHAALWMVAFPATRLIYYKDNPDPSWFDMWDATWKELRTEATLPWVVFGVMSAYKLASRRSGSVPGK